jgi:uncharacterized protein
MSAWRHEPYRWILAAIGVVSTGIGAIGAIVPGLPTTIFLIIASACFARSCPWLEERLLRNRLFAPYMAWVDGRQPMSRRAKAGALVAMWTAVTTSVLVLHAAERLSPAVAASLVGAAAIGTVAITADVIHRLRTRRPVLRDLNPEG